MYYALIFFVFISLSIQRSLWSLGQPGLIILLSTYTSSISSISSISSRCAYMPTLYIFNTSLSILASFYTSTCLIPSAFK